MASASAARARATVGLLHCARREAQMPPPPSRALYGGVRTFNDFVDQRSATIRILEADVKASEVLFQTEPGSYRIDAAEFGTRDKHAASASYTRPEAAP